MAASPGGASYDTSPSVDDGSTLFDPTPEEAAVRISELHSAAMIAFGADAFGRMLWATEPALRVAKWDIGKVSSQKLKVHGHSEAPRFLQE